MTDKTFRMHTPERRREPRQKMTLPHGLTISAYGMPDMPRRIAAKVQSVFEADWKESAPAADAKPRDSDAKSEAPARAALSVVR